MRSAVLAGLAVLAGCGENPPKKVEKIDIKAPEPTTARATQPAITPPTVAPPKASLIDKKFQALGTEPFWAIEVTRGKMVYADPEHGDGVTFASTTKLEGKGVRHSGIMDDTKVSVLIEPGKCSDGMSDTVYQWKATLTYDGYNEQGCARAR